MRKEGKLQNQIMKIKANRVHLVNHRETVFPFSNIMVNISEVKGLNCLYVVFVAKSLRSKNVTTYLI